MILKIILPLIILGGCGKSSQSNSSGSSLPVGGIQSASGCYRDYRALPAYENNKNYLGFENFGVRGVGRCRGHALVSQKMEMLAIFDSQLSHPCLGLDQVSCYNRLYEIISDVLKGNIRRIGGFNSLYRFSQDPIAESILRLKVASTSHRYAADESPMASYEHGSLNKNVFYDLIRRIKLRHRPYVGILGKFRIGNHAVIAYGVKANKVCVRDPNIVISKAPFEKCQNFFYLKNDELFYHQDNQPIDEELWMASLQTDEDERVREYVRLHYEKCLGEKKIR